MSSTSDFSGVHGDPFGTEASSSSTDDSTANFVNQPGEPLNDAGFQRYASAMQYSGSAVQGGMQSGTQSGNQSGVQSGMQSERSVSVEQGAAPTTQNPMSQNPVNQNPVNQNPNLSAGNACGNGYSNMAGGGHNPYAGNAAGNAYGNVNYGPAPVGGAGPFNAALGPFNGAPGQSNADATFMGRRNQPQNTLQGHNRARNEHRRHLKMLRKIAKGKGKAKEGSKKKCCLKLKRVWIPLVLLILAGLAVGGYFLFRKKDDSSEDNDSEGAPEGLDELEAGAVDGLGEENPNNRGAGGSSGPAAGSSNGQQIGGGETTDKFSQDGPEKPPQGGPEAEHSGEEHSDEEHSDEEHSDEAGPYQKNDEAPAEPFQKKVDSKKERPPQRQSQSRVRAGQSQSRVRAQQGKKNAGGKKALSTQSLTHEEEFDYFMGQLLKAGTATLGPYIFPHEWADWQAMPAKKREERFKSFCEGCRKDSVEEQRRMMKIAACFYGIEPLPGSALAAELANDDEFLEGLGRVARGKLTSKNDPERKLKRKNTAGYHITSTTLQNNDMISYKHGRCRVGGLLVGLVAVARMTMYIVFVAAITGTHSITYLSYFDAIT